MAEEESASKKMRVYVGGLGAAMTEDDLRKLFHSVGGMVEAVDFIRTKSRCFAYVDFLPSSQSSISKLFSTYNGCAWKGGKLRLEKAKEHYLARLRREWEEDAQINDSTSDADMEVSAPESTDNVAKSEHIQIFFPSLGEVKSLPISGTGTHKYDFPHVEVPPLPVHFCDCEEHNVFAPIGNSEKKKTGELDVENGEMDEEEIKLMNAVMNKIFERQDASQADCNKNMAVKVKDNSTMLPDDQQLEDNKVDSDEDNLVLNVIASDFISKNTPFNSGNKAFKAHGDNKGSARDKKSISKAQSKKRKSFVSEKMDRNEHVPGIPTGNGSITPECEPARSSRPQALDQVMPIQSSRSKNSSWKTLISDKSNVSFSISNILPSVPTNEEQAEADDLNVAHVTPTENSDLGIAATLEGITDEPIPVKSNISCSISDTLPSVPSADEEQAKVDDLDLAHSTPNGNTNLATDAVLESKSEEMKSVDNFPEAQNSIPNVTLNKGRGSSWRQKSSWTQLVGGEQISSFSITQILPSNTFEKQVQREPDAIDVSFSVGRENDDSKKHDSQCIAEEESAAFLIRKDNTSGDNIEKNQQSAVQENESSCSQVTERQMLQQAGSSDVRSGETCPFMRNSRSLAEWTKIKATFSGGSKNKKARR